MKTYIFLPRSSGAVSSSTCIPSEEDRSAHVPCRRIFFPEYQGVRAARALLQSSTPNEKNYMRTQAVWEMSKWTTQRFLSHLPPSPRLHIICTMRSHPHHHQSTELGASRKSARSNHSRSRGHNREVHVSLIRTGRKSRSHPIYFSARDLLCS